MKILNKISLKLLQVILILELHLLALDDTLRATAAAVRCPERERQALLQFKYGLVDNNGRLSSWGSEEEKRDCCRWEGVQCSNRTGNVEIVDLHGEFDDTGEQQFILQGNISESLLELQQLKYLNLSYNDFGDNNVPGFFGSLKNLRFLDLRSCYFGFGGKIPNQLGNLSNLQYLNLGKIGLGGEIPYQLGNLSQLLYLDLGENILEGTIPYQLGNLSKLQKLDLGFNTALKLEDDDQGGGGQWLSSLTSLTQLDLSKVINLNYSHNWLQMIGKLPNIREVSLTGCSLYDDSIIPLTPSKWQFSDSLAIFDLSDNGFKSSIIFQWLSNVSSNLVQLDLSNNRLEGLIPNELGKLTSIEYLDLSENTLHGSIPESFRDICNLKSLTLKYNRLNEELPTILENLAGCARHSLQNLDLSWNRITGTLSDLSIFTSLETLILTENRLNGSIPEDIRFSSQLVTFSIHSNSLKGVITESHFTNVSNLKTLDFSYNTFTLKFGKNWIPSFQLDQIFLRSCKLGPDFPNWLHTQSNFSVLDISDAGISDIVPQWFWGLITPNLLWLNVSYNNLWGTIPNSAVRFFGSPDISLASNQFEGSIPSFLRSASVVDLSTNKFSESATFLCDNSSALVLASLDISNNQLSGKLPDCWSGFTSLIYLDLSKNNLSGKIPPSIGSLLALQVLIMRNNRLIGELPSSLKTCTSLKMLDVGENKLSGRIPSWIGDELEQLQMLSLRNNRFSGSLPLHICYLTSLQLLDLSLNNLSGQIFKCLKNFTAMIQESSSTTNLVGPSISSNGSTPFYQYDIYALLMWKGAPQMFKHSKLLKSIDLSSNQINGVIPEEIEDLVELISLNLSRNSLSGRIPFGIGKLMSLEFLDLSRNNLSGSIPSSLARIDRLTMLDLSYNHLSGQIPISTQLQSFNGSSYEGNLDLCGNPLEKSCYQENTTQESTEVQEDEDSFISKGFYWSMALGFIIGFWGIFGSVLFNRSWRHAYFKFLGNLADRIYVKAALSVAEWKRRLRS